MTFGGLWRDLAPLVTGTLGATPESPAGQTVILRRPSPQFEDTARGVTPGELQVAAAALEGATSLVLELPERVSGSVVYPAGTGLAGTLQAGATIEVAGETYTLAADAATAGVTLTVVLTAGLEAAAAEGATVVVHPEAAFTFEGCQVSRRRKSDFARPLQADHFAVVSVPAKGAPTVPRLNDSLELEDGTTGRVANDIKPAAFYKLHMGA